MLNFSYQHGGSDLTERRSNEGPRGAEARVTHAEARGADDRAVPRCEAVTSFIMNWVQCVI